MKRWASDVIVDLLHAYELPYAALNPGASYRGLHDSIVNYGGNEPLMMLCQHEETAVQIAHGYAKASGRPMVAILHNLVGLLHANMAIYYAYADRAPVFIIGATGPMDETKRRPRIDWIHTALVQGEAGRAGLGRECAAQLPEPPSAQPEHGEGCLPRRRCPAFPRYARLGARHHRIGEHHAPGHLGCAGRLQMDRHRLRRPRDLELGDG